MDIICVFPKAVPVAIPHALVLFLESAGVGVKAADFLDIHREDIT